jgi:hypothetical protein
MTEVKPTPSGALQATIEGFAGQLSCWVLRGGDVHMPFGLT